MSRLDTAGAGPAVPRGEYLLCLPAGARGRRLLRQLQQSAQWGPAAFNCQPAPDVCVRSTEGKPGCSTAWALAMRRPRGPRLPWGACATFT